MENKARFILKDYELSDSCFGLVIKFNFSAEERETLRAFGEDPDSEHGLTIGFTELRDFYLPAEEKHLLELGINPEENDDFLLKRNAVREVDAALTMS